MSEPIISHQPNITPKVPKLWESIALVLVQMLTLLAMLIAFGVLNAFLLLEQSGLIYFSFFGEILLLVPLLGWMFLRGFSWRETFALRPASAKMVLLAVGLGVLVWFPANAAAVPFEWMLSKIGAAPEFPTPQTTVQMVVLGVMLVVAAPLVEEPMFRGFVLRGWLPVGSGAAILVSGVLFGMLHAQLAQLVALVIVGVLLGVVALRSGSIFPPMALHATFNAISFLALVNQNRLDWLNDAAVIKIGAVVFPLFIWTLILLFQATPSPKKPTVPPTDTDWALAAVGGLLVAGLFGVFAVLDILSRLLPPTLPGV